MASEVRVTASLGVLSGNVDYQSRPTSFQTDLPTTKGPAPGVVAVTTAGTNIDLSAFVQPGLCRLQNQGDTNTVAVGPWDGTTFFPMIDLRPGEFYVVRLSALLGDTTATGTGTGDTGDDFLRAKGVNGPSTLLVEAFEEYQG